MIVIKCQILEIGRYLKLRHTSIEDLDLRYERLPKINSKRTVITLSTIPDRVNLIGPTLISILDQTVRVDEICVNIPYVSRKGQKYVVPDWLSKLKSITVRRVDVDEGPATKLLPTLRRESTDTRIIVIDDDNIYHSRLIETLISSFEKNESAGKSIAITNLGIVLDPDGTIPKFFSVSRIISMYSGPRNVDLLQGCHGFIVTPSMFPAETYDLSKCPKQIITVDDMWFSGWLKVNKIPIYSLGYTYRQVSIPNWGEMNSTPKLVNGENKGLVRDQIVVNWFIEKYRVFV